MSFPPFAVHVVATMGRESDAEWIPRAPIYTSIILSGAETVDDGPLLEGLADAAKAVITFPDSSALAVTETVDEIANMIDARRIA